ncbi:MAG: hypothetical protein R3344_08205 [Acidobacteriota bacterium]|nr:hypothetical protein [Acidobacteriota bacterium]
MTWKRLIAALVCCAVAAIGPMAAQDADEPPAAPPPTDDDSTQQQPPPSTDDDSTQQQPPSPTATYQEPKKKNHLYVEFAVGQVEGRDIDTGIETSSVENSKGTLTLDENAAGRAVIGWELRNDKGWFLGRFEGYDEQGYIYQGTGNQARVATVPGQPVAPLASSALTWYTVTASNGEFTATKSSPIWDATVDDTNGDGVPDPDEVNQDFNNPDYVITNPAPDSLQNRLQTFDVLYQRGFGGRRYHGMWSGGLRYFVYEGNIVATAWLNADFAGLGFTDGGFLRAMSFSQKTSGWGPTGDLELLIDIVRDRFIFYGLGRTAFVLQDLEADSGEFVTLVREPVNQVFIPVSTTLTTTRSKSSWHFGIEMGFRVRLVDRLFLNLSYQWMGYQDVILMPTSIIIPDNVNNAAQGTSGVWSTQDYRVTGWYAGLSFQF